MELPVELYVVLLKKKEEYEEDDELMVLPISVPNSDRRF